jgi:hypothetical protein
MTWKHLNLTEALKLLPLFKCGEEQTCFAVHQSLVVK